MHTEELISLFQRNFKVIVAEAAQISDEGGSRPLGQGASASWVLGHIVKARGHLLERLSVSVEGLQMGELLEMYGANTHPSEDNHPLSHLLELFVATQKPLEEALRATDLTPVVETYFGPKTIAALVNSYGTHEAHHGGQLVMLRHWLNTPLQ